jgi:hypothetical protein
LARQGGNTRAHDLPPPRLRGVTEGARPYVYSQDGPIVEIRKGLEVEMSGVKRRKNPFREALDAKREALASAAKQPKQEPEPEWEPETPELRAEVLADRLAEREAELAKEQGRRRGVDKEE